MIRVLHTIDTTGPGGAETVFINLIKGLDRLKFEPVAAIHGPGWVCDTLRENGIEPLFIQSRGGFNFRYLWELIQIIRKQRIDVIQSHLLGSNLYCSMAGLVCRVPVISTIHGFVDASGRKQIMSLKSRLINQGSRKIVFVSDCLREHYVKTYGFSSQKSMTIYNGIDTSVFLPQKDNSIRKELGLGDEHVLIGAVGNIRPAKGYEYFLKAARRIYDKRPECKFIIAGEGSGELYEGLLNLRRSLGLEETVFFLGFRKETATVFNNLDIFVLPSVSEGFSISTLEAMACGVPVVVTRSGGPEEIVQDRNNGILVQAKDEKHLADDLLMVLENNSFRKELIINGLDVISRRFSDSSMVEKYCNVYVANIKLN